MVPNKHQFFFFSKKFVFQKKETITTKKTERKGNKEILMSLAYQR